MACIPQIHIINYEGSRQRENLADEREDNMAGSIEQRGPNSWRIIISAGYYHNGKRIKLVRTCHGTRGDAEQLLAQTQAEIEQKKTNGASDMTLREWALIWGREYVDIPQSLLPRRRGGSLFMDSHGELP